MIYHYKMKQPEIVPETGDGTKSNPWYWYSKTQGQTINLNNNNTSSEDGSRLYLRVKLLAGTTYYIGETSPGSGDGQIWLYDQNGNELTSADDSYNNIAGIDCSDAYEYTPSNTGIYIIGAGSYGGYSQGDYTVAISPAPESDPIPQPEIIYHTSTGFNNWGKAIKYRSASLADCNNVIIPKEGLDFYLPFDEDVNDKIHGIQGNITNNSYFQIKQDSVVGNYLNCTKPSGSENVNYPGTESLFQYGTGDFSISFWLRAPRWGTQENLLFSKKDNDNNSGFVIFRDLNPATLDLRIGNTSRTGTYNSGTCDDEIWNHWCFIRENRIVSAYKNKTYSKNNVSGFCDNFADESVSNSVRFYIGYCAIWGNKGAYFDLKSLRIYNRVLNEKEINALSKEFKI